MEILTSKEEDIKKICRESGCPEATIFLIQALLKSIRQETTKKTKKKILGIVNKIAKISESNDDYNPCNAIKLALTSESIYNQN